MASADSKNPGYMHRGPRPCTGARGKLLPQLGRNEPTQAAGARDHAQEPGENYSPSSDARSRRKLQGPETMHRSPGKATPPARTQGADTSCRFPPILAQRHRLTHTEPRCRHRGRSHAGRWQLAFPAALGDSLDPEGCASPQRTYR